ncbi:MAG: hypothetical protein ISR65_06515 [Bacteriovoracaceae bacterium]|nr:hypothetical protein [Bacteriovoracaceae bacterium]
MNILKNLFLLFFIFSILIVSCNPNKLINNELKLFAARNYINWFSTMEVTILADDFVNSGKLLDRPNATWWPLVMLTFLGPKAGSNRVQCLIYKVPYINVENSINKYGVLKVVEITPDDNCKNHFSAKEVTSVSGIKNLRIYLTGESKKMGSGKRTIPSFTMGVSLNRYENNTWSETKWIYFPLMNAEAKSLKSAKQKKSKKLSYVKKRYHSSIVKRKNPGVLYFPLKDYLEGPAEISSELLGTIDDSYPDKTSIQCHKVDGNCQTIGDYICDRCRYGWYEVVGSACSKVKNKYCGPNKCGQRGWPACPRGYQYSRYIVTAGCYAGNQSGFCQENLSTYCDENKVLVCL